MHPLIIEAYRQWFVSTLTFNFVLLTQATRIQSVCWWESRDRRHVPAQSPWDCAALCSHNCFPSTTNGPHVWPPPWTQAWVGLACKGTQHGTPPYSNCSCFGWFPWSMIVWVFLSFNLGLISDCWTCPEEEVRQTIPKTNVHFMQRFHSKVGQHSNGCCLVWFMLMFQDGEMYSPISTRANFKTDPVFGGMRLILVEMGPSQPVT